MSLSSVSCSSKLIEPKWNYATWNGTWTHGLGLESGQNPDWDMNPLFLFVLFCFFFLRPHLWHIEVPWARSWIRAVAEACTTVIEMQDLSLICDLHSSLWQCWMLNSLSKARDWTHILMETSQVLNLLSYNGNSLEPTGFCFVLFFFN